VVLQASRDDRAQCSTPKEANGYRGQRNLPSRQPLVEVGDKGYRNEEGSEQEHGGYIVEALGSEEAPLQEVEKYEPANEDL
nr:hypothetical protein [Actinomycetota bacterium]